VCGSHGETNVSEGFCSCSPRLQYSELGGGGGVYWYSVDHNIVNVLLG
jgi:hypothetical protein